MLALWQGSKTPAALVGNWALPDHHGIVSGSMQSDPTELGQEEGL